MTSGTHFFATAEKRCPKRHLLTRLIRVCNNFHLRERATEKKERHRCDLHRNDLSSTTSHTWEYYECIVSREKRKNLGAFFIATNWLIARPEPSDWTRTWKINESLSFEREFIEIGERETERGDHEMRHQKTATSTTTDVMTQNVLHIGTAFLIAMLKI